DVEVPGLAHDAGGGGAGVDQGGEGGVAVGLAEWLAGGAEGDELGRAEGELGRRPPEELLVLGVGLRVAALDPADAEVVELLGDAELVVDRQGDALELGAVPQGRVEDVDARGQLQLGRAHASSTHSLYFGISPRTSLEYSSAMVAVIGPGQGISRSSTLLTAETSAAVPHTYSSSAT